MKGTYLREIKAERNAFEDEAIRLRATIDNFIGQIGGVDQILNARGCFEKLQETIKELEGQKDDQQQIYDAKYDECLQLEKKLIEAEMDRDSAYNEISQKASEIEKKNDEIKTLNFNYSKLKEKKEQLEDEITDLNSIIQNKEDENNRHKNKISKLESK